MTLQQINFRLASVQADALGLAAQASGRTKTEIMRRGLQSEIEKTLREFGKTVVVEPVDVKAEDVRGKGVEVPADARPPTNQEEVELLMAAQGVSEVVAKLMIERKRKKK
jgi:VIT1/CCC1 family predicted Fe2+/Mn2+ transporter